MEGPMRRVGTVLGLLFLASLASGCNNDGVLVDGAQWQEFAPDDGRFKVQLPGIPAPQSQSMIGTTMNLFSLEGPELMYGIGYADMPIVGLERESAAQIDQRLNGAVQGSVNNIKAKLTRQGSIALAGKYPGKEYEANLPDGRGIIRSRIYFVSKRLYMLMVAGKPNLVMSGDTNKFFGSFQITAR
jgi:hypothetical protein